jgi:hypothetical protein
MMTAVQRAASYLSPPEMFRLDLACAPIAEAFGGFCVYLVGSVTERRDFRDVDVRLILSDKKYARLVRGVDPALFSLVTSAYLRDASGLNVDFQVQQRTTATERFSDLIRNPLGHRGLDRFRGDARPE